MANEVGREQPNNKDEDVETTGQPQQYPILETLRLAFLRCVVASSILALGFVLYGAVWARENANQAAKWTIPGIVLTVITPVHHIATAFVTPVRLRRQTFKFIAWLDIVLTVLESLCYIAVTVYITRLLKSGVGGLASQWFPQFALLAEAGVWILTISITLLLLVKVICLVDPGWASPNEKTRKPSKHVDAPPWLLKLRYPAGALFGRKMWNESVPGESRWLSSLRGFLALVAVCALVAYGIYQAVIMPISETGMTPHRTYRTPGLSWTITKNVITSPDLEFKVLLVWARHQNATMSILRSVNATARWRQQGTGPVELPPAEPCRVQPAALRGVKADTWDVAVVVCPQSPTQRDFPGAPVDPWWSFPNFDLSVNYTGLLGSPGRAKADRVSDSVRVYLGATADINTIYNNAEPVSLFPGTNMLSVAHLTLRQRLSPATLATLGFESQESFLVPTIAQTIPDPFAGPTGDPTIATLGFTLQTLVNEWTILQDYRSKSVLSGLAALGGLGTTLTTLLVLLLGTSLMRTLFGSKPHSPFGFLHNLGLGGLQAEMVEKCDEKYPKLRKEIEGFEQDPKEGGIVKYLLDTLIDVETLGYGKAKPNAYVGSGGAGSQSGDTSEDLEKGDISHGEVVPSAQK